MSVSARRDASGEDSLGRFWMSPTVATRIFLAFPWVDRGGPALDILRGQLSVGSEPPILITPPGYVRQVLLPGQECSPAQALIGRRPSRVPLQGTAKPEHDVVRNGPSLTGIDEAEQDQVAQEHPPVRPEPVQQPAPIEAPATCSLPSQCGNVRSVSKPAADIPSRRASASDWRTKTSRSFVPRTPPV